MIAIIDYGMGNLASVKNAFIKLGYEAITTGDPETVLHADRVVLPGVGAFADSIANLHQRGLDRVIEEVVRRNTPLLGICLGFQLLFSESEENGLYQGLDIVKGRVVKFQLSPEYKVPHMGWNGINPRPDSRLLAGIPAGSFFYFVHSYYVIPDDNTCVAACSDYGIDFACAIERNNLFATQFHPEKSSEIGLKILKNFGEM